ncbi:MAG: glycosyltransferase [Bacteroidota bacterium]
MKQEPVLTIAMSTYDDYDGVYFSIQAIRMYHEEIADRLRFLVLDNNPDGKEGQAAKHFVETLPKSRYISFPYYNSTSTRDILFREAETPYVLCMDSHIFFVPGALAQLIDYFEQQRDCRDLIQGPLLYDDLQQVSSHFNTQWNDGMYGTWGFDRRASDPNHVPFEIPMQGLGVFACHKDAWQGFNPRFRGFGGEEGYIHQKFRNAGHRTLCLPFLRWMHRFGRPRGTSYPNKWKDRIRNYLIGFQEVGLDVEVCKKHFQEVLGLDQYLIIEQEILKEFRSPFHFFDTIFFLPEPGLTYNHSELFNFFNTWGIDHLIQAPQQEDWTKESIIQRSRRYVYQSIAVLTGFLPYKEENLQRMKAGLRSATKQEWQHFFLWQNRESGISWEAIYIGN